MTLKDARISIFINAEHTTIEVMDNAASVTFLDITLTAEQLSKALSRQAYTNCEAKVFNLDKVGTT